MNKLLSSRGRNDAGFTLIEMLIAVAVLSIVAIALGVVMFGASRSKSSTTGLVESSEAARVALEMVTRDIRTAGYGADLSYPGSPQRAIAYVDAEEIIIAANLSPYPDTTDGVPHAPLAYNPASSPRPATLSGTAYDPPVRYRTGAELVRYTLDLNNDGAVDDADRGTPAGAPARATPNPDDFVLVRQVYGDSTGNVAGDNGGAQEQVALVQKPGGAVPALFTVYMRGDTAPWDWAGGPVPPSRLRDIERVEVKVTATAGRPDGQGAFPTTTIREQVNSLRNTPDFGEQTYVIDGYVFEDVNDDHNRDTGEPGIAMATVRAGGTYVAYTSTSGYYQMRVPHGTYSLKHTPPMGYEISWPDSFVVTVPPGASRSFADKAKDGGFVNVHVWRDQDGDGIEDAGESPVSAVAITIVPGDAPVYTNGMGNAVLFASTGSYTVSVTPPDSMISTTPNPLTGTMADGGTATHIFGLRSAPSGQVTGKVFRDNNRNGEFNSGEPGIEKVWVGVTTDGVSVAGYTYTNASGDYTVRVPSNDPPRTQPYTVYIIPPAGYFPTGSTSIGGIWVQSSATVPNLNFGMAGYQIITLNASRVLSLAAGDLIEKDWNGNQTQNAHRDLDLVLGADAGGTDNISVWFNNYNRSPLFDPNPDYTRLAPQSVLALALDTLDTDDPTARPDVVTGTTRSASGNFFVWLNQNSSGNLGYFPTSHSPGMNYTTQDGGNVQAILTVDVAGDNMPDLLVGSRWPSGGRGSIEVWKNSGASPPTFTREEVYPSAGSIPGNTMGEVAAMAFADFDRDGDRDLVVGTRTGTYSGELIFFSLESRNSGDRYKCRTVQTLYTDAVTSLTVCDPNKDGWPDVVVGTQSAANGGHLQQWQSGGSVAPWTFINARQVNASGIVMSVRSADLGGSPTPDIVVGWRANESSYAGGIAVYYMDLGLLPSNGVDPSGGAVSNMVPTVATGDFDWGVNPTKAPPYLADVAAGVKITLTTGALVVFIR